MCSDELKPLGDQNILTRNSQQANDQNATNSCVLSESAINQAAVSIVDDNAKEFINRLRDAEMLSSVLADEAATHVSGLFDWISRFDATASEITAMRYLQIGRILYQIERLSKTKSEYMKWIRRHFATGVGLEALRQARRIAELGIIAEELLYLGKNRMLELYYVVKKADDMKRLADGTLESKSIRELLAKYVLIHLHEPDRADAKELRTNMDAAITIFRFEKVGISNAICTFELAKMVALYRGKAIEVKQAQAVKKELPDNEESLVLGFRDWVKNRMVVPAKGDCDANDNPRSLAVSAEKIKEDCIKYQLSEILISELRNDVNAINSIKEARKQLALLIRKVSKSNNTNENERTENKGDK